MANVVHDEINFPTVGPDDAGLIWKDPVADVNYIWDGVKWDLYADIDSESNYWARTPESKILNPRNTDDNVRARSYQFAWLDNLKNAPKTGY